MKTKLKTGLQLYSVRDFLEKDFEGTIAAVAAMGYKGVEFAGFCCHSAETVAALMKKYGLTLLASHVQYAELNDIDAVIDFSKAAGCKHVVISWADDAHRVNGECFEESRAIMRKAGKSLFDAGIPLLYHNHDFEMKAHGSETALDYYLSLPEAEYISPELDTAWIKYAGKDPCEFISRYKDRLSLIHIKDFVRKEGWPVFVPVGNGEQDMPAIVAAAVASSAGWIVVEQDSSEDITSLEAVKQSIEYLQRLIG